MRPLGRPDEKNEETEARPPYPDRPLTERTPKPLVEAGGETLLGRHLARLAGAGFAHAVINVSHLAEQIVARFGDGAQEPADDGPGREAGYRCVDKAVDLKKTSMVICCQ